MDDASRNEGLEHSHDRDAVAVRISKEREQSYLPDAVLGAVDGSVTTFAVVAGAVGGGFSGMVVVVLGFAKVVADAFSMALSNYLSAKSKAEAIEEAERMENHHIDTAPDGEVLEIAEIFRQKGFDGDLLDQVVNVITRDRELWVRTMLRDELKMDTEASNPIRAAATTFLAFIGTGVLPLLPFVFPGPSVHQAFAASVGATGVVFAAIGILKGRALGRSLFRSAVETLITGGTAAALAYLVGRLLRQLYSS